MSDLPGEPLAPLPPLAAPRRPCAWFWPGFALGFLLLATLTCTVSIFAGGLNRLGIADLNGGNGAAWKPPPPAPTLPGDGVAADAESGDAPVLGAFRAGDRVHNVTSTVVNVRATPGYLGKPAGDIVAQTVPGEAVEIVAGPQAADNLAWWRVRVTPVGGPVVEGWMAEATASGVQILGN